MIDPGRPFSVSLAEVIAKLEDRIRHGVERPASYSFPFQQGVRSYQIPEAINAVTRVTGLLGGRPEVFEENADYRVAANRLQWVNETKQPDNGKRVEVEYTTRETPPGLTDFNQGSVLGTLMRITAREMSLMYAQMDEAYRRAFIDHASGVGLDNVVALLGVTRTSAQPAVGAVKFFRKADAVQEVPIAKGVRVSDRAGRIFVTQENVVMRPGAREVVVLVKALKPGADGNVNADTITVMPTPPRGVDGVTNPAPTTDGQEPEPDARLRDRAKHALERAGNATLNAIKFAVLGVDGVDSAEVIDHSIDDSIPLGEVRVRFSGGKREAVFKAVESTRAAGILTRIDPIHEVLVSGKLYLMPGVPGPTPINVADFLRRVVALIKSLPIGNPLSLRRLSALAFEFPGLAELAEAQLSFPGPDGLPAPVKDPFFIAPTEIVRPDVARLQAIMLTGLRLSARAVPDPNKLELTVQVVDASNAPVTFRKLSLDLNVTVRAYSLSAPDDPPERIANISAKMEYANSNSSIFVITAAQLGNFRRTDHSPNIELVVTCPAFAGLQGVKQRSTINP